MASQPIQVLARAPTIVQAVDVEAEIKDAMLDEPKPEAKAAEAGLGRRRSSVGMLTRRSSAVRAYCNPHPTDASLMLCPCKPKGKKPHP